MPENEGVAIVLDKLITDEKFRHSFEKDREETIRPFHLKISELAALLALNLPAFLVAAHSLSGLRPPAINI